MEIKKLPIFFVHAGLLILFMAYEILIVYLLGSHVGIQYLLYGYIADIPLFYAISYGTMLLWNAKRKWKAIILSILLLLIHFILAAFIENFVYTSLHQNITDRRLYVTAAFRSLYISAIGIAVWNARNRIRLAKEVNELKIQALEHELREIKMENEILRAQVNPHLLFNTINIAYSGIRHTNEREAQALLLLSGIMKFSLGNSEPDGTVTIKKELENIKSYITLSQIVNQDRLQINYRASTKLLKDSALIPPIILTDFIQDMLKHGKLDDPLKPANVFISASENVFHFHIDNEIAEQSNFKGIGIGLTNSSSRLQNYYGEKHDLQIKTTDTNYTLDLIITL